MPTRDVATDGIWEEQYAGRRTAMRQQWLKEATVRLTWLQLYVPDGVLLEVGCGTGEFSATAARAGYRVTAFEPSPLGAREARRSGVDVTVGQLADWRRAHPGLRVDALVAWHVLEHMHQPREFLAAVRDLLAPGGAVVLEVPNFASSLVELDPIAWVGSAIDDHVFHFTPAGLRRLLESAGYCVEEEVEFSTRVYDATPYWAQRRQQWVAKGLLEPPLEMVRVLARAR